MSTISPTTASLQTPAKAPTVEATEATRGGKDVRNDGDSDDASGAAAPSVAPQATTNNLGQTIGKNLNVSA